MASFASTVGHNDDLVRKALDTIVAVAPYSSAAITSIVDTTNGDLKALPAGYVQLGRLTDDGASFARETEVSEIFGMGSASPARSDIRRTTRRLSLTLLEVRKAGLQLAQGVSDLSETVADVGGSTEITWDEAESPQYPYLRMIAIARDITTTGEIYIARHSLKCRVTEAGEEAWSDQDQAMTQPLTFTFYTDETTGTPLRHFRGGPGYSDEIVTAEGFTPPA